MPSQISCKLRPKVITLFALFIVSALGAQAPVGNSWTVDASNGPGTDFTTISAAVAASAQYDRIFVRIGLYVENVVIDKGITLVGWNATTYPMTVPANPFANAIMGTLVIQNVPNDQTVIVSGFSVVPNGTPGYSVGLINSRGPMVLDRIVIENGSLFILNGEDVLLQDVRVRAPQTGAASPLSGITIYNSWVQAADVDATGGDAGPKPNLSAAGGAALEIFYPSIMGLARPKLVGGSGGGPWITSSSTPAGGPAIRVFGGIIAIVDDQTGNNFITGGQGGLRGVGSSPTIASGDGGNALEINGGTVLNKKPMVLTPGVAGANLAGGPVGNAGQGSVVSSGTYAPIFDVPALFQITGSTTPGGSVTITFHSGFPGLVCALGACYDFDLALLFNSPSVQFLAGKPTSVEFMTLGASNAAAELSFTVGLPNPLGVEAGRTGIVQGADIVGNLAFLSNPSILVLGF